MQVVIQYVSGVVNYTGGTPPTGRDQYGAYFINVLDDNGAPTNGNNIVVQYQSSQGGTLGAVQSVSIAGQSVKIYDGIVQHNSEPYLNYVLVGNTTPGTPSPTTTPDIKINSVEILEKANSAGHLGKIKINASSSYLPITYYVDDIITSSDNIFIVDSGAHTAKAVDPYDNQATLDFYVPKLDSILSNTPQYESAGLISRWNAAFNPIVFTYERSDFDVTAIAQDDTTLKPKIAINADLTPLKVGDYVYLDAGLTNGQSTYKGAYKVLALSGVNNSVIVIDAPYFAADTVAGFMNSDKMRPYYKVVTIITYVDPLTGRFNTITSTNRPNTAGITKADISSFIQSLLRPLPDGSDYTEVNYRDMGLGVSFTVQFAESWQGNTPVFTQITDPYYSIFAAMQIQHIGGGNMQDFVTQPGGQQLAKWLSDFKEPSYSPSFPFDLPFIYSEQIAGRQIYYKIVALDINRQPLGDNEYTSFLLNENGSYLLNQDGSKFIIARQELVNSPIVEHVGVNRLLINQDFGPTCYYLAVQLLYSDSNAAMSLQLNEQLTPNKINASADITFTDADDLTFPVVSISDNGTVNGQISDNQKYTIECTVGSLNGAVNPKLRFTVYKDEVVIFDRQVVAEPGGGLYKEGYATPGSQYRAVVQTLSTTASVTPIDIPDFGDAPPLVEVPVTEVKIVKIDTNCQNNPVYLRWIGLNGAWNYYRFNYNQTKTLDIQNPVITKDYVSDWENAQGVERVISKDASEKIQVYADALSQDDIDGMQAIKYSPFVQELVQKSPLKWQTIVVNSSTFTEYDTQNEYFEFSITYSKASKNIQTQ